MSIFWYLLILHACYRLNVCILSKFLISNSMMVYGGGTFRRWLAHGGEGEDTCDGISVSVRRGSRFLTLSRPMHTGKATCVHSEKVVQARKWAPTKTQTCQHLDHAIPAAPRTVSSHPVSARCYAACAKCTRPWETWRGWGEQISFNQNTE